MPSYGWPRNPSRVRFAGLCPPLTGPVCKPLLLGMRPKSTYRNRKSANAEQHSPIFCRCVSMKAELLGETKMNKRLILCLAALALAGCGETIDPKPTASADALSAPTTTVSPADAATTDIAPARQPSTDAHHTFSPADAATLRTTSDPAPKVQRSRPYHSFSPADAATLPAPPTPTAPKPIAKNSGR